MWQANFHTRTKQQKKYNSLHLLSMFLDVKQEDYGFEPKNSVYFRNLIWFKFLHACNFDLSV